LTGRPNAKRPAAEDRSRAFKARALCPTEDYLFTAVSDSAFGQIVGRHFKIDAVADQNADPVSSHPARDLRHHDVIAAVDLDFETGVALFVDDHSGYFD
jgi:hypothetical protein